jgi:protein-tyrosine phosphatase
MAHCYCLEALCVLSVQYPSAKPHTSKSKGVSSQAVFDIHYHLLFGLDDGPKTMEASLEMAEASIAEGVTHIVCTPHANDAYVFQPQLNQERLAILNERLGGRLTLGLGCDFYLSYENIEDAYKNRTKYTINGKQFLLVEFSNLSITPAISETFYRLAISGIVPIITHPERKSPSSGRMVALWLPDPDHGCIANWPLRQASGSCFSPTTQEELGPLYRQ